MKTQLFTDVIHALIGGALIGFSASLLLLLKGRIAGISGIVSGVLTQNTHEVRWKWAFLIGLCIGGVVLVQFNPSAIQAPTGRTLPFIAIAGVLVGFGTRLGNGCTSGHGVCGLSRLSKRSFYATCAFMCTGFITATLFAWL